MDGECCNAIPKKMSELECLQEELRHANKRIEELCREIKREQEVKTRFMKKVEVLKFILDS